MDDSILNNVKKMLGIDPSYTAFDQEMIIYINSTFSTLSQIGLSVKTEPRISGSGEKWSNFIKDDDAGRLEFVKEYVFLKVKTIFDPPSSSIVLDSINKQIQELEWRICLESEIIGEEEKNAENTIDGLRTVPLWSSGDEVGSS